MRKIALPLSLLLLGLLAVTIGIRLGHPSPPAADTRIGAHAPKLNLPLSDNPPTQTYQVTPGRSGKPLLLNFWASWCEPCKTELPVLERLYEQYRDRLDIVTVNLPAKDQLDDVLRSPPTIA